MAGFRKSFALAFVLAVLMIFAAVFFELICSEARRNGFCEGELLAIQIRGGGVSAEFFGEKLFCSFPFSQSSFEAAAEAVLPLFLPLRPLIWLANTAFVQFS